VTPFSQLALFPLLAITLAVGFSAARFGRRTALPLQLFCFLQAAWVFGLILLQSGVGWAERLVPSGMLLAGAVVHAAVTVSGRRSRWVAGTWLASGAVAVVGMVAPRLLYGPGARGAGPLFPLLAVVSTVGTIAVKLFLLSLVREATTPRERARRIALLAADVFGALGGGAAISLHITGLAPIGIAAPFLAASVLTAAWAIWSSEDTRGQELLRQGLWQTVITAALGTAAVIGWHAALPWLLPSTNPQSLAGWAITFLVLVPLEPLRQWIADRALGAAFRRPLAVPALASALEREESRADQAERLAEVGKVASAVAHEIRNPLGVILAELKLLEREGAGTESVGAIRGQVQRASAFVDDLLRYARPRPLELEELDVTAAVREAALEAARAIDRGPERLELPRGHGPVIEADPRAFKDVLRNLISNALIATRDRADARVRAEVRDDGEHVRVAIEDSGPGVPREIVDQLFQPFVTGRARDERHPGTGLGLAISARLAQRHGAELQHERVDTGGARFVARWPKRPGVAR
jgi:signal transduction histidine kinase